MKKYFTFFLGLLLLTSFGSTAQTTTYYPNTPIGDNISGYLEYLPDGYSSTTDEYPLLIFIHGIGLSVNKPNPADVYALGTAGWGSPAYRAAQGWAPFTAGNEDGKFILITPLWLTEPYQNGNSQVENIEDLLDYCLANYSRIDDTRIYLAGQSSGAAYVMQYVGASVANGKRIAAVLAASPAYEVLQNTANIMAEADLPLWMAASEFDNSIDPETTYRDRVIGWYNAILNAPNPPLVSPKYSIVPGVHTHGEACAFLYNPITEVDGLNAYQWLKLFQRASPTPVTGFDLQAVEKDNSVMLTWQTATEVNNKEFQVQRSTDDIHFEHIATIAPKASGQNGAAYQFNDQEAEGSTFYYRIKQVDNDGRISFSNVVSITLQALHGLRYFPNPVESILSIEYDGGFDGGVLHIYDSQGKLCVTTSLSGTGTQQVNVQHLHSGMYRAVILNHDDQIKFTFLKQ